MGRPKVNEEVKRSEKITFRVSGNEQIQIAQGTKLCGLATGNFIRHKHFKGKLPEPKYAKIDVTTYLELKKLGVNLNQLAKQVNAGRLPKTTLPILETLLSQQGKIILILTDDSEPRNL